MKLLTTYLDEMRCFLFPRKPCYYWGMSLLQKKCKPCEDKNMKPLDKESAEELLREVSEWDMAKDGKKISREFKFRDFLGSMGFIDKVADIAEIEGHHPDIHIYYDKVVLDLSTHSIGGLSENDFIVAAKINAIWR